MLLEPLRLVARQPDRRRARRAAAGARRPHVCAETHACVVELQNRPAHVGARRGRRAARLRAGRSTVTRPTRAARRGRGHPPARRPRRGRRPSSGARYREVAATMRALAHREPTLAQHVHVAVPDGETAVRALDAPAARPPAAARAVGELAVLARQRLGLRLDAHADLLDVPARRHRRARFGTYADYVGPSTRCSAPARSTGPSFAVVGRAPAAAARHGRGAHHGRAVARRRRGRAGRARPLPRPPPRRASAPAHGRAGGAGREPLPRRPRRHADAELIDARTPGGADRARRPGRTAARMRAVGRHARRARTSCPPPARSWPSPAPCGSDGTSRATGSPTCPPGWRSSSRPPARLARGRRPRPRGRGGLP